MKIQWKKLAAVLLAGCAASMTVSCGEAEQTKTQGEPTSFAYASFDGKAVWLTNGGTSEYKIVVPVSASETEKHAAEELQYFLKQSTDCTLPIVTDAGLNSGETGKYLSVGNTSLLAEQKDIRAAAGAPRNTPVIQTRGNTVYMTGASDEGTLYAAYKFLHYQIGFEAYAVDCVDFDYHYALRLIDFDYDYVPVTSYSSSMNEVENVDNLVGLARMCMRGAANTYDAKLWGTWCHSTEGLAGQIGVMKPLHPEWYGWYDVDGDGEYESDEDKGNGQMCQTNDELMRHLANESVKRLDATGALYTMLGGSDSAAVCGCQNCSAAYDRYTVGGVHIRYLNKIAGYMEDVYKERGESREFVLYGLAYWGYVASPTVLDKKGNPVAVDDSVYCDENVGICYTPIGACWTHALDDPSCEMNAEWYRHLRGYDLLTDNLAIYGYTTNFHNYLVPFNDWNSHKGNAALYEKHGVKYIFHQGNAANAVSPFQSLRTYLQGKLAWDPTLDVSETIDAFMGNYYGAGARQMRKFFDAEAEHYEWINQKKGTSCGSCYAAVLDASYWPYDKLQQFQAILNGAQNAIAVSAATADEKAQFGLNVYKEYVMVKLYEYLNYNARYAEEDRAAVKAELQTALKELGIIHSAENVPFEIN